MSTSLELLIEKLKALENELVEELQKQQELFNFEVRKRKVYFEDNVIILHKQSVKQLVDYLKDATLGHILCAPFIWACLFPLLLLDFTSSLYQSVCFPIYGIPKVKRQDYIIFDRQYLHYLNTIEKINCMYCSYANGFIAYVGEIAARTEQFWCPIKHAQRLKKLHSRYQKFLSYGDANNYQTKIQKLRRDFKDLD
jgi:hypothetical protein